MKNKICLIICVLLLQNFVISQEDHYFLKDIDSNILEKEYSTTRDWIPPLAIGQEIKILKLTKQKGGYYLTYKSDIENILDTNKQIFLNVYYTKKRLKNYKITDVVIPSIASDTVLTVFIPKDIHYFFLKRSYFSKFDFRKIKKEYKKQLRRNIKNRFKNYTITIVG